MKNTKYKILTIIIVIAITVISLLITSYNLCLAKEHGYENKTAISYIRASNSKQDVNKIEETTNADNEITNDGNNPDSTGESKTPENVSNRDNTINTTNVSNQRKINLSNYSKYTNYGSMSEYEISVFDKIMDCYRTNNTNESIDLENNFSYESYYIIAKTTCFTSGCRRAVRFTMRLLFFAKPIER